MSCDSGATATAHVTNTSKTAYEYTAATPTATACIIQNSICSNIPGNNDTYIMESN